MTADKEQVSKMTELLDRLVDSSGLSSDEFKAVADAVATEAKNLDEDGFLAALDKAVGRSKRRRRQALHLLAQFTHLEDVVTRIGRESWHPCYLERWEFTNKVGFCGLVQLAGFLNPLIELEPSLFNRNSAILAAGLLRAPCNLPALLKLTESPPSGSEHGLTVALTRYGAPEARAFLKRRFNDPDLDKFCRVYAAWGLGKLGDKEAMSYLIEMLYDPPVHNATGHYPGNSLWAAQAICDIKGWHFKWWGPFVEANRDGWKSKLLSES